MKQIIAIILFSFAAHLTHGQACGIYRINYVGNAISKNREIVSVSLPTTLFLHGAEKQNSDLSFVNSNLMNGKYDIEITSHLTTPYTEVSQLIGFYKSTSAFFLLKVVCRENDDLKEIFVEVKWDDIVVSVVKDEKFGTLFKFSLPDLVI